MDSKNVLFAVILSTIVLIFWGTFFEAPVVKEQISEKEITNNQDMSSPSIDEDKNEIKYEIIRSALIKNTNRIRIQSHQIMNELTI